MKIEKINQLIRGKVQGSYYDPDIGVTGAYACDMLSRVVSTIGNGQVWITILNSINVVAVAALSECQCVILAEDVIMEPDVLQRADENNIIIVSSSLSTYEICGLIFSNMESGK